MSELGCYLKYDNSSSEYDECLDLEYVYYMWENGYSSETYIIQPSSIYYEKASFCGFTLDHLKTAKRIKQRKFKAVQTLITDFLQEFDYLKFVGERLLLPQFTAGNFYFSYYEYKENGKVLNHSSHFYRIIAIENNIVTFKCHDISDLSLSSENDNNIYTEGLDEFLSLKYNTWYRVDENMYTLVAKKIDCTIENILKIFR